MTQLYPEFELPKWTLNNSGSYKVNLAGSAAAPLSLNEVIDASTDPATTKQNLSRINDLTLGLGSYAGDANLRQTITDLYDRSKVDVKADDVVIANATTGANLLIFQALLEKGDHVISLYPTYGQLVQYPPFLGAEVSYWRLNSEKDWHLDIEELKRLVRPGKTKMIVLNNPHNPTGTVISTEKQRQIVQVARENDIVVFADEIFRPLFHEPSISEPYEAEQHPTTSLLEHSSKEFDKIIVSGSLSKPWGLSGIRIGWAVTTNPEIRRILVSMRQWTLSSVSVIDEIVANEALSPRCRGPLLEKTLKAAKSNLASLRELVGKSNGRLQCRLPAAGGTAFIKVLDAQGEAVDDVAFCHALRDQEGVLLAPGSLTFGGVTKGDFQGHVRLHVTAPTEMFSVGIQGLGRMLGVQGKAANGALK